MILVGFINYGLSYAIITKWGSKTTLVLHVWWPQKGMITTVSGDMCVTTFLVAFFVSLAISGAVHRAVTAGFEGKSYVCGTREGHSCCGEVKPISSKTFKDFPWCIIPIEYPNKYKRAILMGLWSVAVLAGSSLLVLALFDIRDVGVMIWIKYKALWASSITAIIVTIQYFGALNINNFSQFVLDDSHSNNTQESLIERQEDEINVEDEESANVS